jgi:transcriptional regulator with XRE-family HTH domain
VTKFPTDRLLRAARHWADFSQRELAAMTGLTQSIVARIEHTPELARVEHFAILLEATGFRLAVLDRDDVELAPESEADANRRNAAGRRFPAHHDVRSGNDGWWGRVYWAICERPAPEFTFSGRLRRELRRSTQAKEDEATTETQLQALRFAQRLKPPPYEGCHY